jgi:hypothetical protein
MNELNDLSLLKTAIKTVHGCNCKHVATAKVQEARHGKTVWTGDVEIFSLRGHPEAREAYAWNYRTDDGRVQSYAVLKLPPIESASDAVKAALATRTIQGR